MPFTRLALHQALQRVLHGLFGQLHHRVAARELVAAVDDGIQRHRIIVGRERFFFGQHGQHADFERVEHARSPRWWILQSWRDSLVDQPVQFGGIEFITRAHSDRRCRPP
jgi:hypothetical protein